MARRRCSRNWARASRFPVAWLSLGDEDNDATLLSLPGGGLGSGSTGRTAKVRWACCWREAPDRDAVLSAFLNAANDIPDHRVRPRRLPPGLKIPPSTQPLTFLLDHLPPTLHVVLAGRAEPPLPLARYRARQELLELRSRGAPVSGGETGLFSVTG